jgi:replication factor A1
MQVKDLQIRQGKVDLELDIVDVGEIRSFEKFGKQGKVATAVAKDESGDIKITLWNEDTEKVKSGDKIKITNGYVSEWQGEKQLSTGKFGTLEVISDSSDTKKEMTQGPDEAKNKEIYNESKEKLEKIEEKIQDENIEVEDIGDNGDK